MPPSLRYTKSKSFFYSKASVQRCFFATITGSKTECDFGSVAAFYKCGVKIDATQGSICDA